MNFTNVKLILVREIRDQLRDRRTLFVIVAVPVMMYLLLGVGATQVALLFVDQPRTVVVLGAEHLPAPTLLDDDRFAETWFDQPADSKKLLVFSDLISQNDKNSIWLQYLRKKQGILTSKVLAPEFISLLMVTCTRITTQLMR